MSCFFQNISLFSSYSSYFAYWLYLTYCAYWLYSAYSVYLTYLTFFLYCSSTGKRASPAQSKRVDVEDEHAATTATPDSSRKRRSVNKHGLLLTKSGRVAGSANSINAKYDSAYRNAENENRLLGRSLTLGQACGIIGVCLYGADIPMEQSGTVVYSPYFCILCIFIIFGIS